MMKNQHFWLTWLLMCLLSVSYEGEKTSIQFLLSYCLKNAVIITGQKGTGCDS